MIGINNLTRSYVDKKFLKRVARIILKGENKKETGLSIALVGSEKIKKLNKRYRGKNRVTDVLAFGQGQNSSCQSKLGAGQAEVKSQKFPIFPREEIKLGEILICVQEVKKNAKRLNSTFEKELARVLIHGILHLLGYDHEKGEAEAKKMEKKQQYYLSKI